jgi:hypothetical protein
MHRLALVGLVIVAGCEGSGASPQVVRMGGLEAPPPTSLSQLASDVRSNGGYVFVGVVASIPTPIESAFAPAPYEGTQVEIPRAATDASVSDPLGDDMPAVVAVYGADGPAVLVDESGDPSERYVLENDGGAWQSHALPESGTWLFFVQPNTDRHALIWRAAVNDGVADGEGTQSGDDISLDTLRTDNGT